jgi:hypothetical protein
MAGEKVRFAYETAPERADKIKHKSIELGKSYQETIDLAMDQFLRSQEVKGKKYLQPATSKERQAVESLLLLLRRKRLDPKIKSVLAALLEVSSLED